MEIARERRDEAEKAEAKHRNDELARRAGGGHKDVNAFFARLFKRGVAPTNLHNLSDEEIVVLADLIRWKVHDPRRLDAANPWIEVFETYSRRLVIKSAPAFTDKNTRSVPGIPTRPANKKGTVYFMFGDFVPHRTSGTVVSSKHKIAVEEINVDGRKEASRGDNAPHPLPMDERRNVSSPEAWTDATPSSPAPIDGADRDARKDVPRPLLSEGPAVGQDDKTRAEQIAAAIFDKNPVKMAIYWPPEIPPNTFEVDRLIPALEAFIATGKGFAGHTRFLEAAKMGQAREFIERTRRERIQYLAGKIAERDEDAVREARAAGFTI